MARKDTEEFDWLDDPFNDKKAAQQPAGMGSGAKAAVGCGCLFAVVALVVLFIFAGISALDILSSM
ncbi:MAG: hypothetical protein PEGG_00292 [Paraeggerthella hongkongensis]|jgi:hypothetical protein|uniref:hypothetical protein n=1 Tax=Paraeggerthella TaxID=651554 RepID=UPI000DF809A7|nr:MULTISPECIES: hypothetical protein [Paraeggerthella]MBU5404472.1 hypothetical protein [Paraeggerthella hongkongensis]MCD2432168.1 hypothetical protein [Paraeggerthella hominis]MDY3981578.1 hypothetical protein [Paraeggerthella sp.]RDB59957.1 hypothetical protein C1879_00090 [Paraeggerthella hongkongensis]